MADVKIVMTAHKRGQVFVDGHEIPRVFAIEFSAAANSLTEVRLTLRPEVVEIEGPADVVFDDAEHQFDPAEPPGAE